MFYQSPTLDEALSNRTAPIEDVWTYLYNQGQIYFHESLVMLLSHLQ